MGNLTEYTKFNDGERTIIAYKRRYNKRILQWVYTDENNNIIRYFVEDEISTYHSVKQIVSVIKAFRALRKEVLNNDWFRSIILS